MVRKTALVTAMLGAFASQAIAMGLGEIQLHSALNQPLLAEIELLSPTAADLNDLHATLASREAYTKAGVERGFFHTKLRFEVIRRPDGTAAIKVTSHDPVREPYLDFLLEATWGSGQALREYTVLVDPPVLMPAPAPEYEAPVTEYSAPAPKSSTPVYSEGGAASGLVDGEYHVSRNDTTWGVASTVRPDGSVSMEQVMISLLRANPNAFINQNINNLKAGQILRVPSREEMAAITHETAVADVRAQNNQWRGGSAAAPTPAASAAPSETPAAPAGDVAADAEAQLKLVAPKTEAATGAVDATTGDQALDEIRKELTLASEAAEAQRLENSDLSSRVKELEDQISKLHGLIELKDNEMARLAGTAAPTADGAVAPGTEAAPGETAPTTDAELTAPTAPMAETPAADTPAADTSAADTSAVSPADVVTTPEAVAVPAPDVVAAAPPIKPSAADEGSMASMLDNPLVKWGAAGGAVVIGLLAWMSERRRRMEGVEFQESILANKQTGGAKKAVGTAIPVAAAAAGAAAAVAQPKAPKVPHPKTVPQTDSSLFTDFAVSDMGNIQSDAEADPIAEADVYLAYGRYQQAEELIRTALTRMPQRNELRLKLLEVLFAAKNVHAFDTEAEALLATLGSQEDGMWLRAVDMGQELNPGNPLYRVGAMAPSTATAELDNGMDFNLGGVGTAEADSTTPQRDDISLEFDLGEVDAISPQAGAAAPSMPIEENINFDLGMGDDTKDAGEGLLASADEVATKLDLARAYLEMGDPDGARSILQEVLDEGNAAQKSEAQALLSQLS